MPAPLLYLKRLILFDLVLIWEQFQREKGEVFGSHSIVKAILSNYFQWLRALHMCNHRNQLAADSLLTWHWTPMGGHGKAEQGQEGSFRSPQPISLTKASKGKLSLF